MLKTWTTYALLLGGIIFYYRLSAQTPQDTLSFELKKAVEIEAQYQRSFRSEADFSRFEQDSLGRFAAIGQTADAVLNQAEGVYVRNYGGHGGLRTVSIRGFATNQTQLSINGVPYRQGQSSTINFGNFQTDAFQQIELFRSSGDLAFNPLGGHINFGLRPERSGILLQLAAGAFGEEIAGIQSQWVKGKNAFQLGIKHVQADDNFPFELNGEQAIRQNAAFEQQSYQLFWERKLGEQLSMSYFATAYQNEQQLPGPVLTGRPVDQEADLGENDIFQYVQLQGMQDAAKKAFPIQYRFTLSHHQNRLSYQLPSRTQNYRLQDVMFQAEASQIRKQHRLSVVAQSAHSRLVGNNLAINFSPVDQVDRTEFHIGFQHQFYKTNAKGNKLSLASSLRFNYITQYGLLPNLATQMNWEFSSEKSFFLHLHTGYRIPSFNELYYFGFGNADLAPERVISGDVGMLWRKRLLVPVSLKISSFLNQTRNKIIAIPINPGRWSTLAVGLSQSMGAEAAFEAHWASWLDSYCHYSLQQAVDRTRPEQPLLPYTPVEMLNYGLNVHPGAWQLKLQGSYTSWRFALLQNGPESFLPAYHVMQVSLSYLLSWKKLNLLIYTDWENLTNEQYVIIQSYPMPPRSFRIGLRLRY